MRPSRALIDLTALKCNYGRARQLHGGRALAVIKANAYGHGAVECARALEESADGFAVAFLDEAVQLRQAGIRAPILVLEGCFSSEELTEARERGLWIVVHQESQLHDVERLLANHGSGLHVWLKLNSGMHRAGFPLERARDVHQRLSHSSVVQQITLMTHFARADEVEHEATADQIAAFDLAIVGLSGDQSLANSAGVLAWPAARRDWSRPGIMLYGASPLNEAKSGLLPVMTLESEVFAVRDLQPGDELGYGGQFVAHEPCRIGLVAIGYADGYPRTVRNGTPVMVGSQRSRIVGRISMDMLTVDLTHLPFEGVGSRVELWGRSISVNEVAAAADTIPYELLCRVQRVPRQYLTE